ncbi:MAG: radical SAM protein, partial [Thermoleophilia bacterium]|nr:radical SAM protein [Thermoleophilia bacterium]
MGFEPLADAFGRVHRSLRLSVTDRCNLRCRYCMPAEGMAWLGRQEVLTHTELLRLVGVFAQVGVSDVRVTGGEPLVRPGIAGIIAGVKATPGIREVS